ncbi:linear amide C-N hydrolase [Companilactobacillus sp.]|uniref:linear amide C-N hydrolase n=1 Tax=Companilactobacillus sp. TaxID=2767905 RepID=UPI00261D61C9|nr:linear amide C-N hydrolase [Companilactobacillus sp.]
MKKNKSSFWGSLIFSTALLLSPGISGIAQAETANAATASNAATTANTQSGIFSQYGEEINSLNSIKNVSSDSNAPFFTMDYTADYKLDKFMQQGAANTTQLISFVGSYITGFPNIGRILKLNIPAFGCSTFSAATPDGQQLFGRNFDENSDSPAMLVRTHPTNGYASISMVDLGFLKYTNQDLPTNKLNSLKTLAVPYTPLDGMNEKGLTMAVLQLDGSPTNQTDSSKNDITTTSAIRMVLDKADSVDSALALLNQYNMHDPSMGEFHYQISDASGKSVVVEYINNKMSVVDTNHATNFMVSPSVFGTGHGQDRYETLSNELTKSNDTLTDVQAMNLLHEVAQYGKASTKSWTRWSMIYNKSNGTVNAVIGRDYDTQRTYSIN